MQFENELEEKCFKKADFLVNNKLTNLDIFQMTDLLYKLELEREEKNNITDQLLNYNDEIIDIVDIGEKECVDISVSGDNLFFCNGILTKNSFGVPMSADIMFALVTSEELEELNQIMVKQLKNRYDDPGRFRRFVIGVDRSKMKLYDVEDSAQKDLIDDKPIFDKTNFNSLDKNKFNDLLI